MVAIPPDTPETIPELLPTVATPVELLVQVPPPGVEANVDVDPTHKWSEPVIADGAVITVTVAVIEQPVPNVYVITEVPGDTPCTIPELLPIVATPVELLVQVPPAGVEANVVADPTQTLSVPVIVDGETRTVTGVVVVHPDGNV